MRTIKTPILYRSMEFDRASMDKEKRTVELSFSSEQPVERYFGNEILDHSPSSVDMSRLNSGGPLLLEHQRDWQIGVVESARIDADRKGRAMVRFGKSAKAEEVFQDVIDGIRRLVSVGYRVTKMVTEKVENGVETLRAVGWMPMEISIVSVPADTSVGVGRANNTDTTETTVELSKPMPEETKTAADPNPLKVNIEEIRADAAKALADQNKEILAMTAKMEKRWPQIREVADQALCGQIDLATFRQRAFELSCNAKPLDTEKTQHLGMNEREIQQYSLRKAIIASHNREGLTGFEKEVQDEAIKRYGHKLSAPHAVFIPHDVLLHDERRVHGMQTRDQLVATGSLGGNVVATNLLASSFIEVLRNRMVTAQAGISTLPGLVGNTVIPRQTAGSAVAWVGETSAATEASLTFDQVTLTPKTISTYIDYSWLLLQQSTPAIDGIIRGDVQNTIARGIDLAVLSGTGSTQPTGVATVSGIGSVVGGTNGAAPTWAHMVSFETEVATDNADVGRMAYITNAKVRGKLKQTIKGATATDSHFIWQPGRDILVGDVNGYPAYVTNAVRSNLTKGTSTTVCSEIFFGDWSSGLLGLWSGLELLADPYTGATGRVLRLHAYQAVDFNVRHAESFSYGSDFTTT